MIESVVGITVYNILPLERLERRSDLEIRWRNYSEDKD